MYGRTRLLVGASLVVAAALMAASVCLAAPQAGVARLSDKVVGAYLATIVVPPNPLVGNTEPIAMPELVTLDREGTSTATPSLPGFPFPTGTGVVNAAWSDGVSSWEKTGPRRLSVTYWRFLSDPVTGQLLGIAKIHSQVTHRNGSLEGEYTLELLNPDLTPAMLQGQPVMVGPSPVTLMPLQVEPMP